MSKSRELEPEHILALVDRLHDLGFAFDLSNIRDSQVFTNLAHNQMVMALSNEQIKFIPQTPALQWWFDAYGS